MKNRPLVSLHTLRREISNLRYWAIYLCDNYDDYTQQDDPVGWPRYYERHEGDLMRACAIYLAVARRIAAFLEYWPYGGDRALVQSEWNKCRKWWRDLGRRIQEVEDP